MLSRISRMAKEDLGFGTRVESVTTDRFLNRDGSFNVLRTGQTFFDRFDMYHSLLTMSWLRFWITIALGYLMVNALFAGIFLLLGTGSVDGSQADTLAGRFWEDFFFSVQTFTTVGYGKLTPNGTLANLLMSVDALVGLMMFALATGLLFARFSRPTARIIYSKNAVIAPYQKGTGLMFRLVNKRQSQWSEVTARVLLVKKEMREGTVTSRYYPLGLEIEKVTFLPQHWTIVHAIDESSPLWGITRSEFNTSKSEILILLTAVDDTFSQTVHSRTSYVASEVEWNVRFSDMFVNRDDGVVAIDVRRLHQFESVR